MTDQRTLEIAFAGPGGAPEPHLSVDGMTPRGPNLSHWPGNRTPPQWKADLSTGICLKFARAPLADRQAFLGTVRTVVNDHYDTDGFLSMLAVVRPEVALAREAACLLAAATGDYGAFHGDTAFAVDRIVRALPRDAASPLAAQLRGRPDDERWHACYRWLIDHAEQVLDQPESLAPLYRSELAAMQQELARAQAGGLSASWHEDAQLDVLRSDGDVPRMVLNTCARGYRVLHATGTDGHRCYRYHDRTESWFEVVTFTPPTRHSLLPLRSRLAELEGTGGPGQWCVDAPDTPVPELYHGLPGQQEYGEITRTLTPSRLPLDTVVREFRDHLAVQPPPAK